MMNPDSVLVVGIPGRLEISVPVQSIWHTLETIVSGIVVAAVAFFLARRRFKSERWHERRGEAYSKILSLLHVITRNSRRLADVEDKQDEPDLLPPRFSREQLTAFRKERDQAYDQLGESFEEHRYLLSTGAIAILERFIKVIDEDLAGSDTFHPEGWWHHAARIANRDFHEQFLVDVGTQFGLGRLLKRSGRALDLGWYRTRNWVSNAAYLVGRRFEEWKLTLGPQLTQADVRTPPRYVTFKSVEQMKKLGYSRGAIQRELRLQLRADPGPPWEPIPERPPRKQPPRS